MDLDTGAVLPSTLTKLGAACALNKQHLANSLAKMSYEVHRPGEGPVGRTALSKKHMWVFAPSAPHQAGAGLPASWSLQFAAGIQTIALVPVPGGVLQLGSNFLIPESSKMVARFVLLLTPSEKKAVGRVACQPVTIGDLLGFSPCGVSHETPAVSPPPAPSPALLPGLSQVQLRFFSNAPAAPSAHPVGGQGRPSGLRERLQSLQQARQRGLQRPGPGVQGQPALRQGQQPSSASRRAGGEQPKLPQEGQGNQAPKQLPEGQERQLLLLLQRRMGMQVEPPVGQEQQLLLLAQGGQGHGGGQLLAEGPKGREHEALLGRKDELKVGRFAALAGAGKELPQEQRLLHGQQLLTSLGAKRERDDDADGGNARTAGIKGGMERPEETERAVAAGEEDAGKKPRIVSPSLCVEERQDDSSPLERGMDVDVARGDVGALSSLIPGASRPATVPRPATLSLQCIADLLFDDGKAVPGDFTASGLPSPIDLVDAVSAVSPVNQLVRVQGGANPEASPREAFLGPRLKAAGALPASFDELSQALGVGLSGCGSAVWKNFNLNGQLIGRGQPPSEMSCRVEEVTDAEEKDALPGAPKAPDARACCAAGAPAADGTVAEGASPTARWGIVGQSPTVGVKLEGPQVLESAEGGDFTGAKDRAASPDVGAGSFSLLMEESPSHSPPRGHPFTAEPGMLGGGGGSESAAMQASGPEASRGPGSSSETNVDLKPPLAPVVGGEVQGLPMAGVDPIAAMEQMLAHGTRRQGAASGAAQRGPMLHLQKRLKMGGGESTSDSSSLSPLPCPPALPALVSPALASFLSRRQRISGEACEALLEARDGEVQDGRKSTAGALLEAGGGVAPALNSSDLGLSGGQHLELSAEVQEMLRLQEIQRLRARLAVEVCPPPGALQGLDGLGPARLPQDLQAQAVHQTSSQALAAAILRNRARQAAVLQSVRASALAPPLGVPGVPALPGADALGPYAAMQLSLQRQLSSLTGVGGGSSIADAQRLLNQHSLRLQGVGSVLPSAQQLAAEQCLINRGMNRVPGEGLASLAGSASWGALGPAVGPTASGEAMLQNARLLALTQRSIFQGPSSGPAAGDASGALGEAQGKAGSATLPTGQQLACSIAAALGRGLQEGALKGAGAAAAAGAGGAAGDADKARGKAEDDGGAAGGGARGKGGEGRVRPRDRQLIQERLQELRELLPCATKLSIEMLLERAMQRICFLRQATSQHKEIAQAECTAQGPAIGDGATTVCQLTPAVIKIKVTWRPRVVVPLDSGSQLKDMGLVVLKGRLHCLRQPPPEDDAEDAMAVFIAEGSQSSCEEVTLKMESLLEPL